MTYREHREELIGIIREFNAIAVVRGDCTPYVYDMADEIKRLREGGSDTSVEDVILSVSEIDGYRRGYDDGLANTSPRAATFNAWSEGWNEAIDAAKSAVGLIFGTAPQRHLDIWPNVVSEMEALKK
jgi:hypothetical protein